MVCCYGALAKVLEMGQIIMRVKRLINKDKLRVKAGVHILIVPYSTKTCVNECCRFTPVNIMRVALKHNLIMFTIRNVAINTLKFNDNQAAYLSKFC